MIKKTYYDAKGRFCKKWRTPEYKAYQKAYQQTPEYKAKANARYQRQTPEYRAKALAKTKAYQQTPEYKVYIKAYQQTPEYKAKAKVRGKARRQTLEYKARAKVAQQKWRESPEGRRYSAAQSALRKAKKLQRSRLLTEAGKKVITEIHANCPDDWHVDHIVPLQGETVSGLHVPENLQYLPKSVNTMKNNRWDNSWASHTIDTPLKEKIKAYQLIEERVT